MSFAWYHLVIEKLPKLATPLSPPGFGEGAPDAPGRPLPRHGDPQSERQLLHRQETIGHQLVSPRISQLDNISAKVPNKPVLAENVN